MFKYTDTTAVSDKNKCQRQVVKCLMEKTTFPKSSWPFKQIFFLTRILKIIELQTARIAATWLNATWFHALLFLYFLLKIFMKYFILI